MTCINPKNGMISKIIISAKLDRLAGEIFSFDRSRLNVLIATSKLLHYITVWVSALYKLVPLFKKLSTLQPLSSYVLCMSFVVEGLALPNFVSSLSVC